MQLFEAEGEVNLFALVRFWVQIDYFQAEFWVNCS